MTRFHHGQKMIGAQGERAAAYNARLDGEAEGRAVAVAIIRLCITAGRPELVPVFLVEELTVDQVRAALAVFDRPH